MPHSILLSFSTSKSVSYTFSCHIHIGITSTILSIQFFLSSFEDVDFGAAFAVNLTDKKPAITKAHTANEIKTAHKTFNEKRLVRFIRGRMCSK